MGKQHSADAPEIPAQPDRQGDGQIYDHLELLSVMGRDFASTLDIEASLKRAIEHITNYVDAEGGALFMLDDEGRTLRCHASVGPTEITGLTLKSDQGIVGRCVQSNASEIIRDVTKDADFHGGIDEKTGFTTRSILCAPMSVKDECLGAIELINKRGGDGLFADSDLHLLQAMSASAAMAIINARMAEALVEQERLARELELAAEIQRSLLPDPGDEGFPIVGINHPARTVSGDFYDFFPLDDGRLCFNLGDVSGKGM
ncbi:MAG: GAF domain-containing protein, partial [Rhodospirillales bacterium]|nr:GAF domain-containing protein [Rhodospirillales bacterium]